MTAQQFTESERPISHAAKRVVSDSATVIRSAKEAAKDRMRKPTTTAAVAGAAVMGAAIVFGVLETAVGGAAAYVTYRLLKKKPSGEVRGEAAPVEAAS